MKKIQLLFAFIVLSITSGLAQKDSVQTSDTITYPFTKIMVIPFEENMYISGIQSDLIQNSGKSHKEVLGFFRYGIASAIQYEFLNECNTSSLIHYNDTTFDLERTYAKIYYKFEPYTEEVSNEKLNSKPSKKESENSSQKDERLIKNGQITSTKNVNPKFAALFLKDTSALNYLNQKYGADLFVFVTQLDIENDLSDQLALANDTYLRFIRAHYAIVDVNGVFFGKGVVKITFPNTVNEMERIQAIYFKEIAQKLMEKLPKITKPKAVNPSKKKERVTKGR